MAKMNRIKCVRNVALLLFLVVAGPGHAVAAAETRPVQIGVLTPVWGATPQVAGLRDGLRELGYRENSDFVIGVRFTQGDLSALPEAARELVELGPDLIFAHDAAALAMQKATTEIPIVFAGVTDPLGMGLIKSYAKPGGNITGVADQELALGSKRLELFREVIPGLKRVLFPYHPDHVVSEEGLKVYRAAARRLGIELVEKAVRTEAEAQTVLATVRKGTVDGILRPPSAALNIPGYILEASTTRAIPTMFNGSFWVDEGALASYGEDEYASGKQAARLVDKILKGTAPADIPVELNRKVEFVLNLQVAKSLGLTIRPEVLYSADRVVR